MMETETRRLAVSTASHAATKMWSPQDPMEWPAFVDWLDLPSPANQKDCGGYYLGALRGRRKKAENVISRSAVTLDADKADQSLPLDIQTELAGVAMVIHSTWSHTPRAPRFRIIIPLNRDVSPQEYILIVRAIMAEVGPDQFDHTCAQPERMMHRPSARTRDSYFYTVAPGAPLDADVWIEKATSAGLAVVDSSIDDHGAGAANYDPDTSPTPTQTSVGATLLEKAEREVRTLFNETKGEPFAGRNDACIRRLPLLYRFVLGGVLDAEQVDARIFAATLEAEGDPDWDEAEFNAVSQNAWEMAILSGGRRPAVDEVTDVFDTVEVAEGEREWPPYRPDLYFTNRGQFQVRVAEQEILKIRPIARDTVDNSLLMYSGGVWKPGEAWITQALNKAFRNEWSPTVRSSLLQFVKDDPDLPAFAGEPVPEFINCRSGMLDWKTGELLPHSPDYHSLIQIPWEYDPDAECPVFLEFLEKVVPADAMDFIWEFIGYMVYSGNPLQVAPMLYGPGSNGKGTFLNVITMLLGRENVASVALHDLVENRFRPAELYGRIANIAGDLDDRWLGSTALLKQITGDDLISAERKFGSAFSFRPWAVPLFSTNTVLSVSDSSTGWARRMLVIPFNAKYMGERRRELLSGAEAPGILNRAVDGLQTLMERGSFRLPHSVKSQTLEFISSGDIVRFWIDERCREEPGTWTNRADLYADFETWAAFGGFNGMSNRALYSRLEQMGFEVKAKRNGIYGVRGLRLLWK